MNEILLVKFQFTNQLERKRKLVPKETLNARFRLPVTVLFHISEVHAFALANARERSDCSPVTLTKKRKQADMRSSRRDFLKNYKRLTIFFVSLYFLLCKTHDFHLKV